MYIGEDGRELGLYLDEECTKPVKRSDLKGLLPQQIVISETREELADPSYVIILSITNGRIQTKLQILSPSDGESIVFTIQDEEDVEDSEDPEDQDDPDDPEENPDQDPRL